MSSRDTSSIEYSSDDVSLRSSVATVVSSAKEKGDMDRQALSHIGVKHDDDDEEGEDAS
jgi:hypothetical protein